MTDLSSTAPVPSQFYDLELFFYTIKGVSYTMSPRPKTSKSIAAEIERTFKTNMKLLEESMEGLSKNCRAYLDRVMARAKLQREYLDNRASRGLDPVNLGPTMQVRYDFHAIVDASPVERDAQRQAFEDALDAEFPVSQSLLPEPAPKRSKKKRTK